MKETRVLFASKITHYIHGHLVKGDEGVCVYVCRVLSGQWVYMVGDIVQLPAPYVTLCDFLVH